jgi:diguanylate cyclase (GGDEF)-like protein
VGTPDVATGDPGPLRWGRVLALAALAGLAVAAVGLSDSQLAVPFGAVLSGLTGLSGGALVVARSLPVRRGELFRLLIGSAAAVWGAGQVVMGIQVQLGAGYPTSGDLISVLAGPLAIAGLALAPRRATENLAGLRLCCDALVAGAAAAALVWRAGFLDQVDPHSPAALLGVGIILVELSVAALIFISALRELDPGMVAAAFGVGLFVLADIGTQYVVIQPGRDWPWPAMAVICLSWPLLCTGLLRISSHPPDLSDRDRPAAERRRSVVTSGVTVVLVGGVLATFVVDRQVDPVTIGLLATSALATAVREIVAARQASALLRRVGDLAYRDALTGVGNRRGLMEALGAAGPRTWLLTVDLDNFKSVNSLLGHAGGDALLIRAGERLAEVGGGERVFRLGGDEFAVLAHGTQDQVLGLAGRLVTAVRQAALSVPGVGRVGLSASVGVALVKEPDQPLVALAQSATALHAAKAAGRNRCELYGGRVAQQSQRRRLVEVRLREALRRHELTVNAQPVVHLDTGQIIGFELLARWTDDELGPVAPDEFIEIAEATSLIVALGEQVLDLAVRAAVQHRIEARGLSLGINVSPVQLRIPGFADDVLARLAEHGVPPGLIVIEVTEQVFVTEDDDAEVALARLVGGGVKVAVDDFGAGSASLGYLRRIPARSLKLDRALVASVLTDPRSAAIVRSMARLGAETGLEVVAEGIEDAATAAACMAAGIPYGQGWLFARDVPLTELDALVVALGGAALDADVSV